MIKSKKIGTPCIIIIIVLSLLSLNAYAVVSKKNETKGGTISYSKRIDEALHIFNEVQDTVTLKEYGGIYLDGEGFANIIWLKDTKKVSEETLTLMKQLDGNKSLITHYGDYSIAALQKTLEKLNTLDKEEYGILDIALDEVNNRVKISLSKYSKKRVNKILKHTDTPDMITIEESKVTT